MQRASVHSPSAGWCIPPAPGQPPDVAGRSPHPSPETQKTDPSPPLKPGKRTPPLPWSPENGPHHSPEAQKTDLLWTKTQKTKKWKGRFGRNRGVGRLRMARIDPSRQVSMVGSSQKIRYWAKRPNIQKKIKKNKKTKFVSILEKIKKCLKN